MSETDERPTKMRKLNSAADTEDHSVKAQEATIAETDPSKDPSNAGSPDNEDEAPSDCLPTMPVDTAGLSKSQLKKLRKRQEWEAGKENRKAKRREKHREKQARKASEREELKAKIALGEIAPPPKANRGRPIQTPVSLVLDCDFEDLMTEKELISVGAQITRCYSENRSAPFRSHLAISSWGGKLRNRFETVLTNNHLSWKGMKFYEDDFEAAGKELHKIMKSTAGGQIAGAMKTAMDKVTGDTEEEANEKAPEDATMIEGSGIRVASEGADPIADASDVFSQPAPSLAQTPDTSNPNLAPSQPDPSLPQIPETPQIVYLSSDSQHTLTNLSPYTTYIIGGIVDKNRHKGLCYRRACERGIPTAKLPIGEYMTMQSRTVLTINHVVEIMLAWLDTGDWGEAFLKVIPKRKAAKLKTKGGNAKEENDEENEDEYDESEDEGESGVSLGENKKTEVEAEEEDLIT